MDLKSPGLYMSNHVCVLCSNYCHLCPPYSLDMYICYMFDFVCLCCTRYVPKFIIKS